MKKEGTVSVVAVNMNEEKTILSVLDNIPKAFADEILVVDGHSKDNSVALARKHGYKVIFQEGKGRGLAFITGFKKVSGDIIVMLSTDGNERSGDIKKLVKKINEGNDMVIATRFGKGRSADLTFSRIIGNNFFTFLCNLLAGLRITDSMNGFRAIRKEALRNMNLESKRFGIEGEMVMKAGKMKLKVAEVPTVEDLRLYGSSRLNTLKDGWNIFKTIIKEAIRNPPYA